MSSSSSYQIASAMLRGKGFFPLLLVLSRSGRKESRGRHGACPFWSGLPGEAGAATRSNVGCRRRFAGPCAAEISLPSHAGRIDVGSSVVNVSRLCLPRLTHRICPSPSSHVPAMKKKTFLIVFTLCDSSENAHTNFNGIGASFTYPFISCSLSASVSDS